MQATCEARGSLERLLVPWPLFVGVVASFLACCLAGRCMSERNSFPGFQRFYREISPETMIYPTACQVRSLARRLVPPDKIAVVIGGNSILRGAGQRQQELWTRHLQDLLGNDYYVLNLAMNGARPAEFGGTAAEILVQTHPRLLFVTHHSLALCGNPSVFPEEEAGAIPVVDRYPYFFLDAFYKGLLSVPGARAAAILAWMEHHPEERFAELSRGLWLDHLCYSRDLWTGLACRRFCTLWSPLIPDHPFTARSRLPRAEDDLRMWGYGKAPEQLPARLAVLGKSMAVYRSFLAQAQQSPAAFSAALAKSETILPPELRRRTLFIVPSENPDDLGHLTAAEQADYRTARALVLRELQKADIPCHVVDKDFAGSDYVDIAHLSESGGRKLAEAIVPQLRELARERGFLPPPR